jgi:sortase A
MKIHAVWKRGRSRRGVAVVRGLEWILLLFGLAALDVFIWINAGTILFQAYEDWSFDQQLRGLTPSVARFAGDEIRSLYGRERLDRAQEPTASIPASERTHSAESLETQPPAPSAVIGRLDIPRLRMTAMVQEGADTRTLRRAVGHIPGTALPGRPGNVGLAGHRDTFFRALRDIQLRDAIELETGHGTYRYVVESTRIVRPSDVQVLESSGGESLTLVTCYPFYYVGTAPKRFIVRAQRVENLAVQRPAAGY